MQRRAAVVRFAGIGGAVACCSRQTLARLNDYRSDDINSIKENTDEVHDQLGRTFARIANGV